MAKVIIVDDNDNEIGLKERNEITDFESHRASALWIENSKGDILLKQRAFTKKYDAGKWEPAAAGTVEEGENYLTNIIKETEEELGLTVNESDLTPLGKLILDYGNHKSFVFCFILVIDKDINEFRIEEGEAEQMKWFSNNEFESEFQLNSDIFVEGMGPFVDFIKNCKTELDVK